MMQKVIVAGLCLFAAGLFAYVLLETGVLRFNYPSADR